VLLQLMVVVQRRLRVNRQITVALLLLLMHCVLLLLLLQS
jgi:hypothetical protein